MVPGLESVVQPVASPAEATPVPTGTSSSSSTASGAPLPHLPACGGARPAPFTAASSVAATGAGVRTWSPVRSPTCRCRS